MGFSFISPARWAGDVTHHHQTRVFRVHFQSCSKTRGVFSKKKPRETATFRITSQSHSREYSERSRDCVGYQLWTRRAKGETGRSQQAARSRRSRLDPQVSDRSPSPPRCSLGRHTHRSARSIFSRRLASRPVVVVPELDPRHLFSRFSLSLLTDSCRLARPPRAVDVTSMRPILSSIDRSLTHLRPSSLSPARAA